MSGDAGLARAAREDDLSAPVAAALRSDRPTALLCFSDVMAHWAVRAAEDLGLTVPGDLSVVRLDREDRIGVIRGIEVGPRCASARLQADDPLRHR